MTSTKLPSVLSAPNTVNSISMERSLKQIKELLDTIVSQDDSVNDRVEASIDDVDTMLAAIDRG